LLDATFQEPILIRTLRERVYSALRSYSICWRETCWVVRDAWLGERRSGKAPGIRASSWLIDDRVVWLERTEPVRDAVDMVGGSLEECRA
jgi:hypothetical protein